MNSIRCHLAPASLSCFISNPSVPPLHTLDFLCYMRGSQNMIQGPMGSVRQHQGLFKRVSFHISWLKHWSFFSFSNSPSNEQSGLISVRVDWLDLLAVQGTLESLPQHHSSKASILRHSVFFIVQFSYPYMTTGKTIALTRRIFVGKVMSLLYNMLSRFVIAFLPRASVLISWLQLPSAVILDPQQ